ncbi:MAG: NAD(P)/FAD-dependent oxidoreductase [Pseudomonadota bacterium]
MSFTIAIIGAGPAGIGAGRELLQQGFDQFTIFDALDAPGGTWRLHSYPGLACDVWAHSYSFSYRPNPDWSSNFVGYAEIQAYLAKCAEEFGLLPHLRLNTRVEAARCQSDGSWELTTDGGQAERFDVVINAMGNQHTPLYPDVPGLDSFKGESFHGTRWNHDVELEGKRVLVVGSAASAVQIVPEIAPRVGHLTVLQRSANWIMPRNWKPYSDNQRRRWRRYPFLMSMIRRGQGLLMGQVEYAVTLGHKRMGQFEDRVKKFIETAIDDPATRQALTPDTNYGCKRGLVSDDFYPALNRDNVDLVHAGLKAVTADGVLTDKNQAIDADVIIFCTGYRILDFDRFEVIGRDGGSLAEFMADNPRAYKGISAPGFPNYFFAVGPNGLVLNVPYFQTVEKSLQTIVGLLATMRERQIHAIDVKPEQLETYNAWMAKRFERFSWGASDCSSYYRNASGHAPFLYPGNFKEFCEGQDAIGLEAYNIN